MRPYLWPSYRRAFRALLARGLEEWHPGEPVVCCDFSNPAINAVGGRYYFSLVRDLIDAGYFPVFTACRATLSSFGTSGMKSLLLKERLGVVAFPDELRVPYLLITDRAAPRAARAEKIVTVRYEQRLCTAENECAFPVFVHPQLASCADLPIIYQTDDKRPARIFFGGNTEDGKYDKDVIRKVYGMLTRRDMLAVACAAMPAGSIHRPRDAAAWLASGDFHPFVLCETQHCWIPQNSWLEALAKADFFLACPGVGMPLCHNLIEALAAGCVPILQYAAYLSPPLENRVNCLTFHDAQSLNDVVHSIFSMTDAEIMRLRANVRAHYDANLGPGCFAKRLFGSPHDKRVLLLNSYRVPRSS